VDPNACELVEERVIACFREGFFGTGDLHGPSESCEVLRELRDPEDAAPANRGKLYGEKENAAVEARVVDGRGMHLNRMLRGDGDVEASLDTRATLYPQDGAGPTTARTARRKPGLGKRDSVW